MLEAIDRFKFGILAALGVYIAIFMWSQFDTFDTYFEIVSYEQTGHIETDEELELTPENVDLSNLNEEEILNMGNDVNDGRETSKDNYFENQSPAQAAANIKELERQMLEEAGGAQERDRLAGLIADRKKQQQEMLNNQNNNDNTPTEGGDVKTAGKTMVSWSVGGGERKAFQNNKWYVRNPGYKCDNTSRVVVIIDVKVGNDGYVTSAAYNSSKSSGASGCEINTALEYANKSRFEYKASGGAGSGWIKYIFMSK